MHIISTSDRDEQTVNTYEGTIVIRNPTREHTLSDVMVLTVISTKAVKVTPSLE